MKTKLQSVLWILLDNQLSSDSDVSEKEQLEDL